VSHFTIIGLQLLVKACI